MNNKGFTLVELLATIVVLALVFGIVAINVQSFLTSTQDKVFTRYEETMKTAAIEYIVDTGDLPTTSIPVCVKLSTLTKNDPTKKEVAYLDPFENPGNSNDNCMTDSFVYVEVDPDSANRNRTDDDGHIDNNKKYTYKVCLSCDNYKSEDCNKVTSAQRSKCK